LLKAGNNLSDASYRFGKDNDITDSEVYSENTDVIEVQETLSLAEKEKEMIKVALVRHKGKRKPAAKELGISERTLYRKIKEYSLEDL
jgi:transcriptional regulator with PAS, ATPase and Fis domain